MKIKTSFCTLLLFLSLGILNTSAFAAEYYAGGNTFYISSRSATINVYFTPTNNSITTRLHKPYNGYEGDYSFNGGYLNSISDWPLGENSITLPTFTSLAPNTGYNLLLAIDNASSDSGSSGTADAVQWNCTLFTDPNTPTSLALQTIGTNTINLKWDNQGNPWDTSYTLQRRLDGSGTWADVYTQTNMSQCSDTGLESNTRYYYRVRANGKHGGFMYSSEQEVTTLVDQALVAAQQASNAANTAANNSWYFSTYGGSSNSVGNISGYMHNVQLPAIETKLNNLALDTTPPTIQKVAGQNGATCTTTTTFNVAVTATDNKAGQLQAQAQVDGGAWGSWYNIPQNSIPVTLSTSGAHTITVQVKDAAGNISSATMTAFKI